MYISPQAGVMWTPMVFSTVNIICMVGMYNICIKQVQCASAQTASHGDDYIVPQALNLKPHY